MTEQELLKKFAMNYDKGICIQITHREDVYTIMKALQNYAKRDSLQLLNSFECKKVYKKKKELSQEEREKIISTFQAWEKENLIITRGARVESVEGTYGLAHTTSGDFAVLGNTNTQARLLSDVLFCFDCLTMTDNGKILAYFYDSDENEKIIEIG